MILKIDRLAVELPMPEQPDPDAAAAVQELLGGRFGEMSTLMNYTSQSFSMRGRDKVKPYYDLVSNISAEEYGHIELVTATITGMLSGATGDGAEQSDGSRPAAAKNLKSVRNSHHHIVAGLGAMPANSMGQPWQGDYVTGATVTKMLNVPDVANAKFPETRQWEERGLHRILYRFSPSDYTDIDKVWKGPHPEDGEEVEVADQPAEGAPRPDFPPEPTLGIPGYDVGELAEVAKRMMSER